MRQNLVALRVLTAALALGLGLLPQYPVAAAGIQPDPQMGPHARDEARHAHDALRFTPAQSAAIPRQPARNRAQAAAPSAAATSSNEGLRREVFGFAPYWALNQGQQTIWNYSLLSTVAYFGLTVNGDGSFNHTDAGWSGWNSAQLIDMISRAHAVGDRAVVVVKATSSSIANQIVTDPNARSAAIANTMAALNDTTRKMDGVNVDFEGTANGNLTIQQGFTTFIRDLSAQVRQARPDALLSVDSYGGSASGDSGFMKIGDLSPYVDSFFIMAYDSAQSNTPGYAGPTAPLNGWTYNDTSEVNQYLTKAPASKVMLGVPYYGYKWSTGTDPSTGTAAYAKANSGGVADTYAGVLSDFSCALQQRHNWDVTAASPWATWWSPPSGDPCQANYNTYRELYYDNADSLGFKYDLVNSMNLRGTGMWALGYDGTSTDLWNELSLKFVSHWESLGGVLGSGPGVASTAAGHLDAFVRGSDNQLWHRSFDGSSWSPWEGLGGVLTADPSAVASGSGRIDVLVRGSDLALWHRVFENGAWGNWESLGGGLASGPAVSSSAAGALDVLVRGTDNALWLRSLRAGSWADWQSLGGVITARPAAVWTSGRTDVFVRGSDGSLVHRSFDGTSWGAWESLGGTLQDGPAASSWALSRLDVFARGMDNHLWHRWYDGTSWSPWSNSIGVGGIVTASPAAISPASGRIDLLVRGKDNALWHLGINISLHAFDTNTLSSHLGTGDFQIAGPMGWNADYPDPADWYDIFLTTSSDNIACTSACGNESETVGSAKTCAS